MPLLSQQAIYGLLSGPMVWVAFGIFVAGTAWQIISRACLAARKDPVIPAYFHPYYASRSTLVWLIPYAARSMRKHPIFFAASFSFHACAILLPIFTSAHVLLIGETWNISWTYIPDRAADMLAVFVLVLLCFFGARRLFDKTVRYLSTPADFLLLMIVAAPFATGLWAHLQCPGDAAATLLHLFSGEILIAVIPFTRLRHMFLFPFSRGYTGSEFGFVKHARDW